MNTENAIEKAPIVEPVASSAEKSDAPASADVTAAASAETTPPQETKPKRRGRTPKVEAGASQDAPADAAPNGPDEAGDRPAAPKRRGRKPKNAAVREEAAPASSEIMQARALAQISQASVVRRQRRAAERAAEMLATDSVEQMDERPAKPKRATRSDASADAAATGAPMAPAPEHVEKDRAEAKPASDSVPSDAPAAPLVDAELPAVPVIDPALRPHRRGRKPKAYIEAEKAAAAALAARQAALIAARDQQRAEGAAEERTDAPGDAAAVKTQDATGSGHADSEDVKKDARPGRGSRARKSAARDAAKGADATEGADQASTDVPQDARAEGAADAKQAPRTHKGRRDADRPDRSDRSDRVERADKGNTGKANDRRDRRERQKDNRKQRNNRFAPAEPSLKREELSAMKVAELREKARELEIDPTGIKKPELIEVVYAAAARAEGFRDIEGILDIDNQGFGYVRAHGYMPSRDDAFVPAQMIRAAGLRPGDLIAGTLRPMRANDKLPGLAKLRSVNGLDPEQVKKRPKFSDLTPIYPNEPLKMEHGKDSITGRAIDIVSPIGKGQRGLIVSPPKAGKTTILKKICQSIAINNPEVHLICLLVDERPEEVTDMQRSIKGDVVASTFDMPADNHTRVSELVIERAKRIVEMGGDVVVVLDSITRLARAYNIAAPASGRILSGGVDSAALYPPKRFLGAARNIENGGSLTILASALIDTGSKMDEVIFEEFKGTGNMELKLDRDLADRRIFPAIDPIASGTRNEDLLVDEQMRPFMWGIRRILAGMNNTERAAASFIKGLKGTNSNQDFLIRTAKKAADHPDAL